MRRSPWFWLALGIAAYDVALIRYGRPTLSTEFARLVHHPVKRWPTYAAWSYLTAHLCGWLPESRDPLAWIARRVQRRRSGALPRVARGDSLPARRLPTALRGQFRGQDRFSFSR